MNLPTSAVHLPSLFLSHGSPMLALEDSPTGRFLDRLGGLLPLPRAIVVASAHFVHAHPTLTAAPRPGTIHDFGGFPEALYTLRYPAPGSPQLAQHAATLLKQAGHPASVNACRGLDHGAWVPLLRLYPAHDVPVVQLSVQPALGPEHHLRLGEALAPLVADGVLVIGSGHVTHNLRDWMGNRGGGETLPYAASFAAWLADTLAKRDDDTLLAYREQGPGGVRAHPSEEHFLPIYVAWGAAGRDAVATRVYRGFDGPALAMDAYAFGAPELVPSTLAATVGR